MFAALPLIFDITVFFQFVAIQTEIINKTMNREQKNRYEFHGILELGRMSKSARCHIYAHIYYRR